MAVINSISDKRLLDGVGCWLECLTDDVPAGRPALFLDRDGVIVEETHYLSNPADLRLIDGVAGVIAEFNAQEIPVIVVTNQAGIGRGYYNWSEFAAVQAELIRQLATAGARVDAVLACAYHDEGKAGYGIADHPWRKPNPGMFRAAAERLKVDLSRSVIVGDKISDLEAGAAAGLSRGVLVLTGYGQQEQAQLERSHPGRSMTFEIATDLTSAATALLQSDWE